MTYPKRIFFTGAPGSRWSGVAQCIETLSVFNITDRSKDRTYSHNQYSGHKGAYFGEGMEFPALLNEASLDYPYKTWEGIKLHKSHEWALQLEDIKEQFPSSWTMLVYRPDMACYSWWHQAGGFEIQYPNYGSIENSINMLHYIQTINNAMLDYSVQHNLTWHPFTEEWCEDVFKTKVEVSIPNRDILVSIHS